ncbi:MAG: hypothetical protein JW395_3705 [Nitrospira sp.]|nr:hypothetical protein [Nitrospira sp.]
MRYIAATIILAALASTGCILEPDCTIPPPTRIHGRRANLAGHESDPQMWVCETQLRTYLSPTGPATHERDLYLLSAEDGPCPIVPIP